MALRRLALLVALLWLVNGGLAGPVQAQYFGQNVVRHHRFDFQVLETERFDIYYYAQTEEEVQRAALLAERWYTRLSRVLGHELRGRQPLILYANHPHFRQTNVVAGGIGEGTGGLTEAFKRRIVLPFAGTLAATDHVIGHELVHAFQFDMTGERGVISGIPGALRLPLWFIEGMAEYLSIGPVDPHTAMWMRDAVLREELPAIRQLDQARFFPYRYGHAFWAFVAGEYGDEVIGRILRTAGQGLDATGAIEDVLGIPIDDLSDRWHAALREAYEPLVAAGDRPEAAAQPLVTTDTTGGTLNIGPSLSPDGRRLVFLSERGLFSIDLYLADAETGEVIRRLVRTAADPHFDSLQFISSAGGWHPDGRQFVFAAVVRGEPVLTILDTERGRTQREIRLEGLGEIFNPSFSPDGRRVAFSANVSGVTDLFVHDLESGETDQLTSDAFAVLGPVWSPDGRTLAFATDRFTTDLEALRAGPFRIALLDVESGQVREAPGFEGVTHLDPQWGRDGSLYFIANREGIRNVYRVPAAGGEPRQVTNLAGGVSGITAESPALSVATEADRLVFSAFEGGDYNLYALGGDQVAGGPLIAPPPTARAAVLPPRREGSGEVFRLLQRPQTGLPDQHQRDFPVEDYRAGLSLDFAGQPTVAVGADQFGAFVGGGVSFVFSDMLGNHQLATGVQINGGVRDFGGLIGYMNRTRRANWGVALQRVPFRTGGVLQRIVEVDGQNVLQEQLFLDRQIYNDLSTMVSYPFSRAARIEFDAGVTYLGFDREVDTRLISLATGRLIAEERQSLPAPDGLAYGQGSAALVYDSSVFGATGPILGQRARFEFGRTAGDLDLSTALADYRRYVMPVRPFTVAGRLLHFGRYGGDAEDPRLFPLFIGYQHLVRGYDITSLGAGEAGLLDRLAGSRMLVANLEVRFPLLGLFSRDYYGAFPLEGVVFTDAGVAWGRGSRPAFAGGDIQPVTSAGVGLRANVFGIAVLELDFVRPFDRPLEGWVWQFGFVPGF